MRIVTALLVVFVVAASLSADAGALPLLDIHRSTRARTSWRESVEVHLAVTQQGRVLGQQSWSDLTHGWSSFLVDTVAGPAALADLKSELRATRVGQMPASCELSVGVPYSGRYTLTWYGRWRRSVSMVVEVVERGTPDPCPAEMNRLLRAIDGFVEAVTSPAGAAPGS